MVIMNTTLELKSQTIIMRFVDHNNVGDHPLHCPTVIGIPESQFYLCASGSTLLLVECEEEKESMMMLPSPRTTSKAQAKTGQTETIVM